MRIENVIGDGNCLFRSLSRFIFGTEDLYPRVRKEIYEEAVRRRNNYPDINNDNADNRHLMILLNQNNIHFQIGYYQPNTKLDYNFEIQNINKNILDEQDKKITKNIDKTDDNNSKDDFSIFMISMF